MSLLMPPPTPLPPPPPPRPCMRDRSLTAPTCSGTGSPRIWGRKTCVEA
jgi:hypothetical protein